MKDMAKEILREYEEDRTEASRLLDKRKEMVYKKEPRILEIENELTATGIKIAKKILVGVDGTRKSNNFAMELEESNKKLVDEKNRLLKKHGISLDFFTDIYKCPSCKDTGFIKHEKCPCFRQKIIDKYYAVSNLSGVLKYENFDYFDNRYYSTERVKGEKLTPKENMDMIYSTCLKFVKNFDTSFENLLFYGHTGLGKTFLCNCIAKDILDKGRTVIYLSSPRLFDILGDYRFNRDKMIEPDEYIAMIYTTDLLIIDDLGTEILSMVTTSEILNIINQRYLDKKHIIISTNLEPGDYEDKYSDRFTSRVFGNYRLMRFYGDDIRLKKKYKGIQ